MMKQIKLDNFFNKYSTVNTMMPNAIFTASRVGAEPRTATEISTVENVNSGDITPSHGFNEK